MYTICSQILQGLLLITRSISVFLKTKTKTKRVKHAYKIQFQIRRHCNKFRKNLKVNPEMPVADKPKANMFWGIVLKADKR